MIDLHNHLLGEEEPAGGLGGALGLCAEARRDGVEEVTVTLRMAAVGGHGRALEFERRWQELRAQAPSGLKLHRGYEWPLEPGLAARLRAFAGEPALGEGRYLLTGLPALRVPADYERALAEVARDGYRPIIAHPECSRALRRAEGMVARLEELGALIQIDALSLLGGYGDEVQAFADHLLGRGQVHFIATRARPGAHRAASLRAAREQAGRVIGRAAALRLVRDNPRAVLEDADLGAARPPGRQLSGLRTALGHRG